MHIGIDSERLLEEKEKSKDFACEKRGLQRTQFSNYYKNKVPRVDLTILAKICDCLDCASNDILKIVRETAKDEQNVRRHVKLFTFFCACIPDKQN